ncbi:MAG: glycosyltransferase family 39 protein [Acidobacteria bacterium]|nr:glycosyltransferase family 39 protein [Acidobacteriota bacterium]
MVIMLSGTSPELSWDEADYAANTARPWGVLWSTSDDGRHDHGPMGIYLAKLGQTVLSPGWAPLEVRLPFFGTLVASLAVGSLYGTLRHLFGTSRGAALVGSSMLLFSAIRVKETNIIGPHHLMLACLLAIVALGYHWRDRPTLRAGVGLGAVMGFGALSMT